MAEFKLERFKYNWRGTWQSSIVYNRDDVVRVNGVSYVCVIGHTSSANFNTDLDAILPGSIPPQPQPKWVVMTSTKSFVGEWQSSNQYQEQDIVIFDGSLWVANNGHFSSTFHQDAANWTLFVDGVQFKTNWQTETNYGSGALVKYNGIVYRCINAHRSQTELEDNVNDWEVFHNGIEFAGNWTTSTIYRKNDLVRFGGSIFKCKRTHTSQTNFADSFFDIELPGYRFDGEFSNATNYGTGSIVSYGGNLYYCNYPTIGVAPDGFSEDSTTIWIPLVYSYNFRGDWDVETTYNSGDLVRRGGELYRALITTGNEDGSTLDYLDSGDWELVVPGQIWNNAWDINIHYEKGDIVYFFGDAWLCTVSHTGSLQNFPGDNGSGINYWDLLIQSGDPAGMNERGDLLTYNLSRDEIGDGSTFGPTNIPIGLSQQLLSVDNNDNAIWRNIFTPTTVVYVSPIGIDSVGRGLTPITPFATVRYATQYVEDNIVGASKIAVSTGRYEEVCPMIIPANCVVNGDELRSVTIVANPAKAEYNGDYPFTSSYLTRLNSIMFDLLLNEDVTPTQGNNQSQIKNGQPASLDTVFAFQSLVDNIKQYIEFRVLSTGVDVTLTGSNTVNANLNYARAVAILENNLDFIKEEAVAFLRFSFPNYVFTEDRVKSDVNEFIRGIKKDLRVSGNYNSLQAARYYVNSTLGSQTDDMFYLRDTTGLRNCTVEGLQGNLNPPGVFDLFQRPTGGAFCSLDPGWGPADNRTWIVNRSPYIQGVTTIGTACVGQKIDGSLHNGGNRSMTSNDFTQVLSDGIGAWVLNNGRAELVSVFTYYCAVGYLAEDGGVIRATNGNCSYGRYGAIADGIDDTEIPATATVNNRNNEAQVISAFSGEITDFILAFEYTHAGENYTTANSTILGAGNFAETVFEDFRDGALFESRLTSAEDSSRIGGAGFTVVRNNAQTGTATSITLSSNDDNEESTYLGLRIVIVSGVGTGQYGYITAYNSITKVAQISRESDNQPGWDNIIEGTPIESSLATNTQYSIEPRIEINHPGFTQTIESLPNSAGDPKEYTDVTWGTTTESYTGNAANPGTGTINGATATNAQYTIVKTGKVYSAIITNIGAGYAVGDSFTIPGADLGGNTPTNNCTITVTETSEDSTNSVVAFTVQGLAFEGRWVGVSSSGNYAIWSDDGETWDDVLLPTAGNWIKVQQGGNRFVAIKSGPTNEAAFSLDGKTWNAVTLPATANWVDIAYGNGRFVIIANGSTNAATSINGSTWAASTLPTGDDSSGDEWQAIAYGGNRFVVITGSQTRDVAYSSTGTSWSRYDGVLPAGGYNWAGMAFGSGRFVAISTNNSASIYSLDLGETWQTSTISSPDDSTAFNWRNIKYGQGVFFAVGDTGSRDIFADTTTGPTTYCATSENGLFWTDRTLNISREWRAIGFGNPNGIGYWIALAYNDNDALKILTGCKAKVRAQITAGAVEYFKILDPGSGYNAETNPVNFIVTDNTYTVEFITQNRLGNGVLAQPTFINRGIGYRTSTTTVTITGDGFADIIPEGNFVILDGLERYPGPGAQILFSSILDLETLDPEDLKIYTAVIITPLGSDGAGNLRARVRISPSLENEDNLQHNTNVSIRERYSQCRISGHDFLDIGTGNFIETNYPDLYADGAFFSAAPENEAYEENGGRVFYVSTDQDGNFRAGELFSVQQASGIVTISADFFDLGGLSEISLGGVRLGGSGTVVREFSTDPTFTEDSNNIVPTQKAIATFLASRLSEGGSEIETNVLVAGSVRIGTEDNIIGHTAGGTVRFPKLIDFSGDGANTKGMLWAQRYFLRTGY